MQVVFVGSSHEPGLQISIKVLQGVYNLSHGLGGGLIGWRGGVIGWRGDEETEPQTKGTQVYLQ